MIVQLNAVPPPAITASAGASLHEPPPPNYNNWPSIFWRPFLVVVTFVLNFLATFFL